MNNKVPFNTGILVTSEGSILEAWAWGGSPDEKNPKTFNKESDAECIEFTKSEIDLFIRELHLHRFDHQRGCVVCVKTGEDIAFSKSIVAGNH